MPSAEKTRLPGSQSNSTRPAGAFERQQPCQLCQGREVVRVGQFDRRGAPLSTVICVGCGLISHEHVPSKSELDAYYAKEYRRDYHGQVEPSAHRIVRAWRRAQSRVRRLSRFLRPGDRVLDIGSGLGCTVKAFELAGYQASGIEPGEAFREFSRRRLGVDVAEGTLDTLPPEPRYDFVMLSHVIEHLPNSLQSLGHIHQLLRPGGRLVLSCPNASAPHAAPAKMFHYAHVFNFTPDTLTAVAEAAGFALHKQLSASADPNLMLLLDRAERPRIRIRPGSFERAYAVFTGHRMRYYARPSYLVSRCQTLFSLQADRFLAQRRLDRILADLQPLERAA